MQQLNGPGGDVWHPVSYITAAELLVPILQTDPGKAEALAKLIGESGLAAYNDLIALIELVADQAQEQITALGIEIVEVFQHQHPALRIHADEDVQDQVQGDLLAAGAARSSKQQVAEDMHIG